jgi:hypothetical protein
MGRSNGRGKKTVRTCTCSRGSRLLAGKSKLSGIQATPELAGKRASAKSKASRDDRSFNPIPQMIHGRRDFRSFTIGSGCLLPGMLGLLAAVPVVRGVLPRLLGLLPFLGLLLGGAH